MQNNDLTVLLIEDSPQYAELVRHWLSAATDGVFQLSWTETLAAGINRLDKGGVDVILLDPGLPDSAGVKTYTQTKAHAPKIPTLVLSASENESLALEMIQKGAEDYLVKSNCNADSLIRAMRYAIVRHRSSIAGDEIASERSHVIGVVGAKGGVGTTTIACTLASELRAQTGQQVLLMDLDPDGGNVSFLTGIDCKYSVQEAAEMEGLDIDKWEATVAQAPGGLKIIPSGTLPGEHRLQSNSFRNLLKFTQPVCRWVVLDLGRLSQDSLALITPVDEVFVVTTSAIPALYNAKRAAEVLRNAEIEPERIRIIVNHAEERQPVSTIALKNMLGIPVFATIPNDSEELFAACVEKRLPGPHSHVRQAIAQLVQKMTGLAQRPRRGTFSSLFSLGDRFRKPAQSLLPTRTA